MQYVLLVDPKNNDLRARKRLAGAQPDTSINYLEDMCGLSEKEIKGFQKF